MSPSVYRCRQLGLVLSSAIALAVGVGASVAPAQSPSASARNAETTAITRPSEERKLSFPTQGVIKTVMVKEGDRVKAGQPLMLQDDDIDLKELDRLKLLAESQARIQAAEADLGVKQAIFKRKSEANDRNKGTDGGVSAFAEAEIEEAKNDVVLREKQLQVAREDQMEAKIKYEQQKAKIEKLTRTSTIDGIVEKIVYREGEWADPQSKEGAIVVVKNDPLYVEVRNLNTRQVAALKMGQKLQVRYVDDKAGTWNDAEIFYFAAVADAASDTQLVRLRMPNPDGRAAGLQLTVKLPPNIAALEGTAPAGSSAAAR